jgi:hypothetical protein
MLLGTRETAANPLRGEVAADPAREKVFQAMEALLEVLIRSVRAIEPRNSSLSLSYRHKQCHADISSAILLF